jgi:hypothetical protein
METITTTTTAPAPPAKIGNLGDAAYAEFRARVARRIADSAIEAGALFTTDADLWQTYLASFPEETRQQHNCRACRQFIERAGTLAAIGPRGELVSVAWGEGVADEEHRAAVAAMERAVRRASVTGVFLTSDPAIGRAVTGIWTHLAAETPTCAAHTRRDVTADQAVAEKKQDHGQVMRALADFPLDMLRQVAGLLRANPSALYRAEKISGQAQWLAELAEAVTRGDRVNLVWRAVATAPAGFCHPRSSMIGSLLEDLLSGMGFDEAAARFAKKMEPDKYQRPQAPPSGGAIEAAEKLVARLGIAPSLRRRYARLEEIEAVWRPAPPTPPADPAPSAIDHAPVFGHLKPKEAQAPIVMFGSNLQPITWEKLARTVLTEAQSIEAYVPRKGDFCALVTAEDQADPPILQWDRPDRRNPVSWYLYKGGSMASRWNLASDQWTRVDAVAMSPAMWFGAELSHHARGALFVIAGARDVNYAEAGNALFPETLRSELHGARSVIEAYSRSATIGGADRATACGLLFGAGNEICVRVVTRAGVRLGYKIDRWD